MRLRFSNIQFLSEDNFRKPSVVVLIFSICFSFWFVDLWKPFNQANGNHNFHWDVFGYYSYLPGYFCNNGSMEFDKKILDYNPPGPLNKHVPKYTYGLSVMYAPFFGVAYFVASSQNSLLDGFSDPFVTWIHWSSIFYVLLGLFFLRKLLLAFFNEMVTAITLAVCLFGSMLFMYTYVQSEMTHGYLFSLFSIFLYLTYKWHQSPNFFLSFWVGFVIGLITLIRPTEIFILLFFILWNVRTVEEIKLKFNFFVQHFWHLLFIGILMVAWWIPQLLFYKNQTGNYFYFSYMRERFFWSDPQIINVLFSYRKGWITYTPIVAMAFVGFFFVNKKFPISKWSFIGVTALILYVLSCWWDWNYGGCFGARSFCQQIAILAIPFASFVDFVFYSPKKFILRPLLTLFTVIYISSCICLNIGHSYHYNMTKKIHPWGTSKKIYWNIIRQYQFTDKYQYDWWGDLKEPDFLKYSDGSDRDQ